MIYCYVFGNKKYFCNNEKTIKSFGNFYQTDPIFEVHGSLTDMIDSCDPDFNWTLIYHATDDSERMPLLSLCAAGSHIRRVTTSFPTNKFLQLELQNNTNVQELRKMRKGILVGDILEHALSIHNIKNARDYMIQYGLTIEAQL